MLERTWWKENLNLTYDSIVEDNGKKKKFFYVFGLPTEVNSRCWQKESFFRERKNDCQFRNKKKELVGNNSPVGIQNTVLPYFSHPTERSHFFCPLLRIPSPRQIHDGKASWLLLNKSTVTRNNRSKTSCDVITARPRRKPTNINPKHHKIDKKSTQITD